jgi:hypothetical protein
MAAAEVYESVTNGSASDFRALVANPEGEPTIRGGLLWIAASTRSPKLIQNCVRKFRSKLSNS